MGLAPARVKDRLFVWLCLLAATAVIIVAASRGSLRSGLIVAAIVVGYAVIHELTRRLSPAAHALTGEEATDRQIAALVRATRVGGYVVLAIGAAALVLDITTGWEPGVWIAGCLGVVVIAFALTLWFGARE